MVLHHAWRVRSRVYLVPSVFVVRLSKHTCTYTYIGLAHYSTPIPSNRLTVRKQTAGRVRLAARRFGLSNRLPAASFRREPRSITPNTATLTIHTTPFEIF